MSFFLFSKKSFFIFLFFCFQISFIEAEDFLEKNQSNNSSNVDNKNFEEIIFKKFDKNGKKKIQKLVDEIGQEIKDFLTKNPLESTDVFIKYLLGRKKEIKIEKDKELSKKFKDITKKILNKYEKLNKINFSELKAEFIKFSNSGKIDKSSININHCLGIAICAKIENNLKLDLTALFNNPEVSEKIYLSRNKEYTKILKNKLNEEIRLKSLNFFKENSEFFKLSNELAKLNLFVNFEEAPFELTKERCLGFKENDKLLKRSLFGFLTSSAIISGVNFYNKSLNFKDNSTNSWLPLKEAISPLFLFKYNNNYNLIPSLIAHGTFISTFNLDYKRIAKKEFKGPLALVLSNIYEDKKEISDNNLEFVKGSLSRSYQELIDDIVSENFENLKTKEKEYINFSNELPFNLENFLEEINEKIKYSKPFEKKYLQEIKNKTKDFIKYYSLNEKFKKEVNNPILALLYLDRLNKNENVDSKKSKKERSIDAFNKEFGLINSYFKDKKKEEEKWKNFCVEIDKIVEKCSSNGFYFSSNITNEIILKNLEEYSLGLTTNFALIFAEKKIEKLKKFESEKIEFNLKQINEASNSCELIRKVYEIFQENLQKKDFEKELFFQKINLILQKNDSEKLAKYLLGKEESGKLILEEKEIVLRFIKLLQEVKKSEMAEKILNLNHKLIKTKIKQEGLGEDNIREKNKYEQMTDKGFKYFEYVKSLYNTFFKTDKFI